VNLGAIGVGGLIVVGTTLAAFGDPAVGDGVVSVIQDVGNFFQHIDNGCGDACCHHFCYDLTSCCTGCHGCEVFWHFLTHSCGCIFFCNGCDCHGCDGCFQDCGELCLHICCDHLC